jgi:soluble lytic murein transglycosylase-like protein
MRSLLIVASVWAACVVILTSVVPTVAPCLMPAYKLSEPDRAYLKAFHHLVRAPQSDAYDALIAAQARRRHLNARLLKAVIAAESGFDPLARSPRGARGLMQVMPATAREMGVYGPLDDPALNINAGAAYLAVLHSAAYKKFGLTGSYEQAPYWLEKRVAAAYNAGPKALSGRGWCRQTRLYADKVMFFYRSDLADLRLPGATTLAARE